MKTEEEERMSFSMIKKYLLSVVLMLFVMILLFISVWSVISQFRQKQILTTQISDLKHQIDAIGPEKYSPDVIKIYQTRIQESEEIFKSIDNYFSKPSMFEPTEVEKNPIRFIGDMRAFQERIRASDLAGILPPDLGFPKTVPPADQIPVIIKELEICQELCRIWSSAGIKRVVSIGRHPAREKQIQGTPYKYKIYPSVFVVEGTQSDILKMLMLLRESDFLFVVKKIDMSFIGGISPSTTTGQKESEFPLISSRVELLTYVFSREAGQTVGL